MEYKRNKKQKRFVTTFIIILLIFLLSIFLAKSFLIEQVKDYDIFVNVDNITGFNISISESSLYFGTAPPLSKLSRDIILNNPGDDSKRVIIKAYGDIQEWIAVSENSFIIEKNSGKTIKISIFIPENAEFKRYSGKLKLIFIKSF